MTDTAIQRQPACLPQVDLRDLAVFLDFDGTLAPIEPRPDLVRLPPDVRNTLVRLLECTSGAVAILSGRDLTELDRLLAPLQMPAAGSHGLVRRNAAGLVEDSAAFSPELATAQERMEAFARRHGLLLEPKRGGTSLHYRSDPGLAASCLALADEIEGMLGGLRIIRGHMVVEVTIRGRDKGSALAAFLAEAPFHGRTPLAVGDDTTDEDAFRAAQEHGGFAIRIGSGPTRADHSIPDIDGFHRWLRALAAEGSAAAPDGEDRS